jgi:ADP-ribosyl-[dinitrogen reductase] hydrolase
MNGGGVWEVGPGQITDDGELALSLWQALSKNDPNDGFPADDVIEEYAEWCYSNPFDIENTCGFSFKKALSILKVHGKVGLGELIREHVKNSPLQANGALMRATPISQWVAPHFHISAEKAADFAREDAKLSHSHPVCQDANAAYTFAIVHLLRGLTTLETLEKTNLYVNKYVGFTVRSWFEESVNIDTLDCTETTGFVKYGFVLAFYFLKNPYISFEEALRIVLTKGGDTDTNAAIVGGMLSAFQDIPSHLVDPVLKFDCLTEGNRRPAKYSAKRVLKSLIK